MHKAVTRFKPVSFYNTKNKIDSESLQHVPVLKRVTYSLVHHRIIPEYIIVQDAQGNNSF